MRGLGRLLEGHPGLQGEKQWEVSLTGNCIWVEHNNVFQTTFFVQAHRWKVQVKTDNKKVVLWENLGVKIGENASIASHLFMSTGLIKGKPFFFFCSTDSAISIVVASFWPLRPSSQVCGFTSPLVKAQRIVETHPI